MRRQERRAQSMEYRKQKKANDNAKREEMQIWANQIWHYKSEKKRVGRIRETMGQGHWLRFTVKSLNLVLWNNRWPKLCLAIIS